ncbi:MAG: hypothetical protein QXO07_01270 [Candidatus Aenigmatarchaeota archaeon]
MKRTKLIRVSENLYKILKKLSEELDKSIVQLSEELAKLLVFEEILKKEIKRKKKRKDSLYHC